MLQVLIYLCIYSLDSLPFLYWGVQNYRCDLIKTVGVKGRGKPPSTCWPHVFQYSPGHHWPSGHKAILLAHGQPVDDDDHEVLLCRRRRTKICLVLWVFDDSPIMGGYLFLWHVWLQICKLHLVHPILLCYIMLKNTSRPMERRTSQGVTSSSKHTWIHILYTFNNCVLPVCY